MDNNFDGEWRMKLFCSMSSIFLCAYSCCLNQICASNLTECINFDQIFYENDYTKAYNSSAKIYYLLEKQNDAESNAPHDLIFMQIWHYALNTYFHIMLMTKSEINLSVDDLYYLLNLNEKILEKLSLINHNLISSSKNIFIESNKNLRKLIDGK